MAKPSLSDFLSVPTPNLLKANTAQADAIYEARMVGDRSIGARLEAAKKLEKPPEELSYRSHSPFAEATKYLAGSGAAALAAASPIGGKMLGGGLMHGILRKGIERNDEAFGRDDLSSYDQALQMLPLLYAADPGAFMRGMGGAKHILSTLKQKNPLSYENIGERGLSRGSHVALYNKNGSLHYVHKDSRLGRKVMNSIRPGGIPPENALAKVPIQKGAYQSALARLTLPTGQDVAAPSAMSTLVGPSFSLSQRYPMPPRDSSPSSTFDRGDALLNRGGDEYDDVVRKWYSLVSNGAFNVDDTLIANERLLSAQKILARVAQQADHLRGQPRFEDKITPQELREILDMARLRYRNGSRPISAADASMRNLRNPFSITTDYGELRPNNIYAPIKQDRSIDEANDAAVRSLWDEAIVAPKPPAEPRSLWDERQFVKMAGSGKEYYVEDALSNPEWKNWSSAHVKPLKSEEYLQGLNSQEFIDKLNQNIAALNKSGAKYTVSPSYINGGYWEPKINVTYTDGHTATSSPYFDIRPGAVDIPTGLEGLPEELKVASYFDGSYPGLNATNTIMGGILNPSETGGGTHFYEALAKTLRETGKGNLSDGRNSKSEHSLAVWEKIKPEKGFSFYHRGKKGLVGGGFNSVVPLIPGLLGLMGQKEERDGSSDN